MFYPFIKIILFFIFLFIYYFIFNFEFDFYKIYDLTLNVTEDNNNNINVGTGATVNINNPNLNASMSKQGINNIAAAISSAGGATAGFKVAQYLGGPPTSKIIAGLATMAAVQATTTIMSRVLNNNGTNSSNDVNKFICSLATDNNGINNLNGYPLNLLFEINTLLYAALLFLLIILNIYIAKYISNLNYSKFIPNNNIGKVLNFLISRYIKIWSKTSKFLLIFSYIMLFLTVFISKLTLYIIFNFYK